MLVTMIINGQGEDLASRENYSYHCLPSVRHLTVLNSFLSEACPRIVATIPIALQWYKKGTS